MLLSQLESKRSLVGAPRLAIENVWTGTHSFYLGGHLEIECWVAFSLPLTGRLSFSLSGFLCSVPLTAKLHKEWWMLMETHGVVIMDHCRVSRKDRDRQTETERGDCWLRMVNDTTESVRFFEDGAVAPLSGETFNYCNQGYHKKCMIVLRLNIKQKIFW